MTWVFRALGLKYSLLLPLAALVALLLTLVVLLRGKGPMAAGALVLIVPMPFFVGLYGGIDGLIAIYTVIAASAIQPKPSELAEGTSMALAAPMIGMLLMAPAYVLAMVGLIVRSMVAPKDLKDLKLP
ncbi:MAG TPA: hypothetical protein VFW87_26505 [Pirellulales bacterium]|nr:hypothetical protein [Pirellulales bacterium]